MASSLAELEEDRKQYAEQLDIVVSQLKSDPDNVELQTLEKELSDMIAMIDESINDLKPKQKPAPARKAATPPPPPSAAPAPPAAEKWSRENHPAFKKAPAAPQPPPPPPEEKEDAAAATYAVNDNVMARWVSGDRAFYPARITSITGSSADRLYTVKFKNYDTMETLRARDIRPMASSAQKRKADGTPAGGGASAVPPPPPPPEPSTSEHVPQPPPGGSRYQPPQPPAPAQSTGVVTSVAARINPDAARQQAEAAAQASEGPSGRPKFKKLKTKELEAGKSKWQDFTTKSRVAKVALKKESMFRTPEGVHGRVGFIGSGQAMRKDPSRSRHVYQTNDDLD